MAPGRREAIPRGPVGPVIPMARALTLRIGSGEAEVKRPELGAVGAEVRRTRGYKPNFPFAQAVSTPRKPTPINLRK